jgi:hypothetical protein
MSILYATVSFEDIDNQNCLDTYVDGLCDIFSNIVKKVASLKARHVTIDLKNMYSIKQYKPHLKPFTLTIKLQFLNGIPLWYGIFTYGSMNLKIIATIEKRP